MDLRDFEVLTFDCYGTLIDWERGILEALGPWRQRQRLHTTDDELLQAFAELEAGHEAAAPAKPYPQILEAVFADLASKYGVAAEAEQTAAFGRSVRDWPAFADSADALARLKQRYKLAIISNIDRASFAHSQARLGVEFDAIITAQDVGSYKPDRRNFEYALTRLDRSGVRRRRILHVAQSLFHDHEPAKALGLATVWVNRRAGKVGWGATRAPCGRVQPDLIVDDLASLAELVEAAQTE